MPPKEILSRKLRISFASDKPRRIACLRRMFAESESKLVANSNDATPDDYADPVLLSTSRLGLENNSSCRVVQLRL
jgi:hypothetical protein